MSLDATVWAWKQQLKATDKLVLLSLADRANEDHCCWPSYDRLQSDTGLHRRTISASIKRLEAAGVITKTRRYSNSTVYQLTGVSDRHSSAKTATNAISGKSATTISGKSATTISGKSATLISHRTPHRTPQLKNTSSDDDGMTEFDAFWTHYPKKKAKKDAEKSWRKLEPDRALVTTIITNLEARAAAGEDAKYYPNPATYLNGERWNDEITRENGNACNQRPNKKHLESLNGESTHDWRDPNNTRSGNNRPLLCATK